MKRMCKLLSLILVGILIFGGIKRATAEEELTWNMTTDPKNYSNSKSSGTICFMANVDTKVCKIFYNDNYEIIFSNEKDGIIIAWLSDSYGTAYFCKEIDNLGTNINYQIFYYNRDVSNDLQPLIINDSKIYSETLHIVKQNVEGIIFKDVITEDGSKIEEINAPSFDELLDTYEKQKEVSPSPSQVPSESSMPSVTEKPSESPSFSPSNNPSESASVESSAEPVKTLETKAVVKKSGTTTTTKVVQGNKTLAKISFNKKTGNAKFYGKKKVKNLKYAFIIKKSYNYGYLTKKGKFRIINRKTKKVKKYSGKWKKSGKNVVKIKNGKKTKKILGI